MPWFSLLFSFPIPTLIPSLLNVLRRKSREVRRVEFGCRKENTFNCKFFCTNNIPSKGEVVGSRGTVIRVSCLSTKGRPTQKLATPTWPALMPTFAAGFLKIPISTPAFLRRKSRIPLKCVAQGTSAMVKPSQVGEPNSECANRTFSTLLLSFS